MDKFKRPSKQASLTHIAIGLLFVSILFLLIFFSTSYTNPSISNKSAILAKPFTKINHFLSKNITQRSELKNFRGEIGKHNSEEIDDTVTAIVKCNTTAGRKKISV